jgi:hypothetical protein
MLREGLKRRGKSHVENRLQIYLMLQQQYLIQMHVTKHHYVVYFNCDKILIFLLSYKNETHQPSHVVIRKETNCKSGAETTQKKTHYHDIDSIDYIWSSTESHITPAPTKFSLPFHRSRKAKCWTVENK